MAAWHAQPESVRLWRHGMHRLAAIQYDARSTTLCRPTTSKRTSCFSLKVCDYGSMACTVWQCTTQHMAARNAQADGCCTIRRPLYDTV
ncbi:hypothetical protein J6590_076362 [Homalodisca vitripennis]|nr:hypothetical protein J6590_076362 [Homalodisca vitripennis]